MGLIARSRRISSRRDNFRFAFRRLVLFPDADEGSVRFRLPCPLVGSSLSSSSSSSESLF